MAQPIQNSPPEFSQVAFIIGKWTCDVKLKLEDGTWQPYQATWVGRYILDGYVIADEYRMIDQTGAVVVHGMNFRTYSVEKKAWVMKWISATGAFWIDLGPEELGGVHVTPGTITSNLVDTFTTDELSRVTFSNISERHFTWSSHVSRDQGKTWDESMVIEASRAE